MAVAAVTAPETRDRQKVVVRLVRDDDGYPPASEEGLWAEDLGNDLFRIDNVPFFAPGLAVDDIVRVHVDSSGEHLVDALHSASGHSTVRVLVENQTDVPSIRERLRHLGCESELSHISTLVSLDIPPEVDYSIVRAALESMASSGLIDYEESALRHHAHQ